MNAQRSAPIRVALADDDEDTLSALQDLIAEDPGFEVVGVARDGKAILDIVGTTNPRIVIMDVAMPKGDGITATQELKQRYVDGITVIGLSANGDPRTSRRMRDAGADRYLVKGQSDVLDALREVASGF